MLFALTTVGSNLFGAFVAWYFSRRYYKKAGADLMKEAAELRRLNAIILHALEDAELVDLNTSEGGEIIGLRIHASVVFEDHDTLRAEPKIRAARLEA